MSTTSFNFLTLSDASKLVGITTGRLRQMLRAGTLKGMKAGPRAWLVAEKEVLKLRSKQPTTGRPRVGKKS